MRRSHGRNRDGLEIARRARRLRAPPVRGAHRIGGGAVPAHGDARPLSFSHHPGSGGKPRDILSSRRLDFAFARFALFLPTMPATKSIAVLGAGVTGLTAAHRLVQGGHRVRVFERSGRIGGAIRTERTTDGWLVESGPNTLLSGKPGLAALLDELGLADERVDATPTAKQRFIVRGGRLVPAPLSPPAFLTSRLFSPFAKARVLAEFLVRPRGRATDLSLASFIRAHFGQEFVDYALNPFVAGVYAGDPQQLSARHAFPQLWELERRQGSLLRALTVGLLTSLASTAPWLFFGTLLVLVITVFRGLPANVRELRGKLVGVRLFEKEDNENPVRWDESPTTTAERRLHHGDVD